LLLQVVLESVLGVDFYLQVVMLEIGGMSFFELEDSIGGGASDTRLTFEPQEATCIVSEVQQVQVQDEFIENWNDMQAQNN
jgi:hypothetical protein